MSERIEVTKGIIRLLISRLKNQNNSIIDSLKQREAQLVALVEERTADLREEKLKVEMAYEEISAQNESLEQAYEEINKQKDELQEKTRNITSSINYAKRIQESILPAKDVIQQYLPNSFVLFKPRDTVSGDFYWFIHKDGIIWIAAVDCTGHGVPGAFMSMIGNTLLNQIVYEKQNITPAEVLHKLHMGVRKALKQDHVDSKNRDGMDIALCAINKKDNILQYSGANRPLLLIQNGELAEYKADKQSIGGVQMEDERLFTDITIEIKPETYVYLFSDGYVDQFGGVENRKFMSKRFKELVMNVYTKNFEEQNAIFTQTIEEWMHGYSQIDDIMVIGYKID
jgi:serine phosphatase RsbU (regulator of sigma subunit)